MRNRLHDGPTEAFQILNGRVRRPGRPRASLAALQWAAERAGLADEANIQEEYEKQREASVDTE